MTIDLLKAIQERPATGQGIATAEGYVRDAMACGADVCKAYFGDVVAEKVLQRAASTLTYCGPQAGIEYTEKYEGEGRGSDGGGRGRRRRLRDFEALVPEGIDAAFPEDTLLGFRNIVTHRQEDRDTDILEPKGAIIDPEMPLLWQHIHTLPIGKMVCVVDQNDDLVRVCSALLDMNALTEDAAKLIEAGALRISHGFRALEWEARKGPKGEDPTPERNFGFRIIKFEMMEHSLVSVPANTRAVIELFSRGKLESDFAKAWGKRLFDERPAQAAGVEKFAITSPSGSSVTLTIGEAGSELKSGAETDGGQPSSCPGERTGGSDRRGVSIPTTDAKEVEAWLADNPPEGEKGRIFPGQLTGSWEWVEHILRGQATRFMSRTVDLGERTVWLAGTFPDHAIVCSESVTAGGDDEFAYFRVTWTLNERGIPVFEGEPERVEIEVTAELSQRSPLYAEKHPVELPPAEVNTADVLLFLMERATEADVETIGQMLDVIGIRELEEQVEREYQQMLSL